MSGGQKEPSGRRRQPPRRRGLRVTSSPQLNLPHTISSSHLASALKTRAVSRIRSISADRSSACCFRITQIALAWLIVIH
jgi:hypothetical protein